MIPGKPFDPATETSRRPTPTTFAHLRKWVTPYSQDVEMTSITEITNINQQLEQVSRFFVSSIIQRVISQMVAAYGDGLVSLQCTEDGHLIVQSEREAKTNLRKDISFAVAASNEIVAGVAGKQIKITNLAFTVFGETNITLQSAGDAISGAMDFGAADEPRGMVQHFGDSPLETVAGEAFNILASAAVQVSGYVTYYIE